MLGARNYSQIVTAQLLELPNPNTVWAILSLQRF
jgi:hypothetical protein